jgi:hypothetical protein
MSDELRLLQQRIDRLVDPVGDVRDRLRNCIQVAGRPEDALALGRGLAESLVKQVLEDLKMKAPPALDACLRELERPETLSRGFVPSEIISLLHMVRILGNKATHNSMGIRASSHDAGLVLQSLLRVVEWYFVEFERGPKFATLYRESQETPTSGQRIRSSSVALIDASLDPHDSPYEQVLEHGVKVIRPRHLKRNDTEWH